MTAPSTQDRFRQLVSLLIAFVTILAAITTFLQTYASNQAAETNRRAQELSLEATTERISGTIQFSSDWQGVLQTWWELDLQRLNAQQEGDTFAAERYRALRDQFTQFSPLLRPPYLNAEQFWPDGRRYEANLYIVEATRKTEQFTALAELGNAWDDIANTFVIQLTLLAVTLSLYGLSHTIEGWARWLFIAVGSFLVIVCLGWMAYVLIAPLPHLPEPAIDAYAQGVGMAHQGQYQEAVEFYNQALTLHPEYANALFERGNAEYSLGDYEAAAASYTAAQAAGRNDTNLNWNLGWTYYLLGRYEEAIQINQTTLQRDPTLVGVRMNQGLALLATGRFGNANVEYDLALEEAFRQVSAARASGQQPPLSLWFYMEAGAADLQSLIDSMNGTPKPWTQAPPPERILADFTQLREAALLLNRKIKETWTALEITYQLPGPPGSYSISNMQVAQEILDEQGNLLKYEVGNTYAYGINEVVILFDYAGMTPEQTIIWKVYWNGFEDPSLRSVSQWNLAESGQAVRRISFAHNNVFIFSPGEYVVELYVDYHLMGSVTFTVE